MKIKREYRKNLLSIDGIMFTAPLPALYVHSENRRFGNNAISLKYPVLIDVRDEDKHS